MKIKQKPLVLCILLCKIYLYFDTTNVFSQISYAQDADCQNAVSNSIKRIENAKATVVNVHKHNQTSRDYPENRPLGYVFSLSGAGSLDVLVSRVFLSDISKQIISSCQSISSVGFAKYQTDGGVIYGLMKDSKIERFECVAPRPNIENELPWGKYVCI
jgi:hypothetical protein